MVARYRAIWARVQTRQQDLRRLRREGKGLYRDLRREETRLGRRLQTALAQHVVVSLRVRSASPLL